MKNNMQENNSTMQSFIVLKDISLKFELFFPDLCWFLFQNLCSHSSQTVLAQQKTNPSPGFLAK